MDLGTIRITENGSEVGRKCNSPINGGFKKRRTNSQQFSWNSENISKLTDKRLSITSGPIIKRFSFLNDQVCALGGDVRDPSRNGVDDENYSQAWFTHYKRREHLFKPWNMALGATGSKWEALRLQVIHNFWKAVKSHRISPITIHLAVWLLNRLLNEFYPKNSKSSARDWFSGTAAVALRIALKFEERPETLWGIRRIWEILPVFENWNIDRSDQYLLKLEAESLRALNDCLDVPLSVQFFDKFIAVGGWPSEMIREYTSLGHFLLALSTFATGDGNQLQHMSPSKLAAATVVLSVKIVNGDSKRTYEFFPERFEAFSQMSMKDLQPAIKGLSQLLRKKPEGSAVLGRVYNEWGEHEWQ